MSGAKTVTAAGALVTALTALSARRIGFASPYVDEINDEAIAFLAESGFETVSRAGVGVALDNYGQGEMTPDEAARFGIDKLHVVRSEIPAVTHVDYSARVQTVHADTNPRYHALIEHFGELTGVPVVMNTSFNLREEPIVCAPKDAVRTFFSSGLDALCLGPFLVVKS